MRDISDACHAKQNREKYIHRIHGYLSQLKTIILLRIIDAQAK